MHFIEAHQRGEFSVSELCRRFGISRKTGYKWLERF
jgi:putative transposase